MYCRYIVTALTDLCIIDSEGIIRPMSCRHTVRALTNLCVSYTRSESINRPMYCRHTVRALTNLCIIDSEGINRPLYRSYTVNALTDLLIVDKPVALPSDRRYIIKIQVTCYCKQSKLNEENTEGWFSKWQLVSVLCLSRNLVGDDTTQSYTIITLADLALVVISLSSYKATPDPNPTQSPPAPNHSKHPKTETLPLTPTHSRQLYTRHSHIKHNKLCTST